MRQKMSAIRQTMRGAKHLASNRLIKNRSDRREMIRYPEFLKISCHIGSEAMESWEAGNAESMMALEAID